MNARDLIHRWANGSTKGKAGNLQIIDKGDLGTAIMHYATELCLRTEDGRLFVHNATPYSSSTKRVQSYISRSIHGGVTRSIWDQSRGYRFYTDNGWKKDFIDCRAKQIRFLAKEQAGQKARRLSTIRAMKSLIFEVQEFATGDNASLLSGDDRESLHLAWNNASAWEAEEIPKQAQYEASEAKRLASLEANRDAKRMARNAKWEEQREESQRLAQLTEAQRIEEWRNGANLGYVRLPMMLRIKGDKVETSQGASVSIAEADRGMRIIDHYRAKLVVVDEAIETIYVEGEKLAGLYRITDLDGHRVAIGCHAIPWEEYDRFKAVLAHHIALSRPQA